MKIMRLIILFVMALFVLQGCYEDKGNYDYISFAKLKITLKPENRKAFLGEPYVYYPEIEFSDETDTTGFEFWWEFTGTLSGGGYDTLCVGRELNFIPQQIGYLWAQLCVRELATGIITSAKVQLQVESPYAKGWLILTENAGKSCLSYVRPGYVFNEDEEKFREYKEYKDVYQKLYPNDKLGDNPYRLKQVMNSQSSMILVLQDNDPVYLDGSTYQKIMTMDKEFVGEKYPDNWNIKDFFYGTGQDMVLDKSGQIYSRNYMGQGEYDPFFSCAFANIPVQYDGQNLKIEKFIYTMPSNAYFFGLYDIETNRILWPITGGTDVGSILAANMNVNSGEPFVDLNNLGTYKLLFGGTYEAGTISGANRGASLILLLGDQYNNIKLQEQLVSVPWPYPIAVDIMNVRLKDFSGARYITENTQYFMLETRPYLFFATNNKLYWYDVVSGVTKEFYTFSSGDEVVEMSSNPQESELGILLKSGTFIIMNIQNEKLYDCEKMYELSGLGTGISLMYKYPTYTSYSGRTSSLHAD